MERLRTKLRFSLQTKVFFTFVVLLLFVLGCFIVYVNQFVIVPSKERALQEKMDAAIAVSSQLDFYIDSQNQLSQRILSTKDVFKILEQASHTTKPVERLNQIRRLQEIMFQAIGPRMNMKDMAIYDRLGKPFVAYIGSYAPLTPLALPFVDGKSGSAWNEAGYLISSKPSGLSFLRAINNQNGRVYGYLSIELDETYIASMIGGSASNEVHVLDGADGTKIASNIGDNSTSNKLKSDVVGKGVYVDENNHYVSYYTSPNTGWITYLVTPKQDILGPINAVIRVSVVLITALMLISFVYIYFSARNLLLPIRKLRSQIWRLNYSNMNIRTDQSTMQNNDLLLLNEAFQDLMERLQQSIDREKVALHEEVKARNSALQAQIAPHFIHNVLYLISIAAQEGRTEAVSQMCKHLSDSLRYIVTSPYAHVTLADELEHTRHYLSLVQQKYEDDLNWEIHSDDSSNNIELPRLTIQPFVENCIEHAFSEKDPPWDIIITVKQFNGLWVLEIKDNGAGFTPDKIKEIMHRLELSGAEQAEGKDNQIGIGNMGIVNSVHRLKLMYQNRLFFNIYNHVEGEKGATIQIIGSLTNQFYS